MKSNLSKIWILGLLLALVVGCGGLEEEENTAENPMAADNTTLAEEKMGTSSPAGIIAVGNIEIINVDTDAAPGAPSFIGGTEPEMNLVLLHEGGQEFQVQVDGDLLRPQDEVEVYVDAEDQGSLIIQDGYYFTSVRFRLTKEDIPDGSEDTSIRVQRNGSTVETATVTITKEPEEVRYESIALGDEPDEIVITFSGNINTTSKKVKANVAVTRDGNAVAVWSRRESGNKLTIVTTYNLRDGLHTVVYGGKGIEDENGNAVPSFWDTVNVGDDNDDGATVAGNTGANANTNANAGNGNANAGKTGDNTNDNTAQRCASLPHGHYTDGNHLITSLRANGIHLSTITLAVLGTIMFETEEEVGESTICLVDARSDLGITGEITGDGLVSAVISHPDYELVNPEAALQYILLHKVPFQVSYLFVSKGLTAAGMNGKYHLSVGGGIVGWEVQNVEALKTDSPLSYTDYGKVVVRVNQ